MTTIQAGYEVPDYSKAKDSAPMVAGGSDKKLPKKTVFPDFTLRGPAADALIDKMEAGETFTATVTMKLSRTEKRAGSPREWENEEEANRSVAEVEIHSIECEGSKSGMAKNESDEEDAESAVDAYRASKSGGAGEGDEEED